MAVAPTIGPSSVDRLARSKRPTVERAEIHIPPVPLFPVEAVTGDPRARAQAIANYNLALQKWRNDAWSVEAPFVPDSELQNRATSLEDTTSKMSKTLTQATIDIEDAEENITTIQNNLTTINTTITAVNNAITGTGIVQANGSNPPTAILGSQGHVPYWNAAGAPYLAFTSPIYTDGTLVGIGTDLPAYLLDVGLAGTRAGVIRLAGGTSGNVVIQTAATAGTWTLTLPVNDGNLGDVLTTDGSGITSWTAPTTVTPSALTKTDDTNVTLTLGGSPAVALLAATSLTLGWTGQLSIARGGTNATSFAVSTGVVFYNGTSLATDSGITYDAANDYLTLLGPIKVSKAAPWHYLIDETDQAADEKKWTIFSNAGRFQIGTLDDAESLSVSFLFAIRSGNNPTSLTITRKTFIGGTTTPPTAHLHLEAGTASATTAPLKFTSGTNLTAAEAGAMEYNGRFFLTDTDAARRHIVQAVDATKTTAGAPYANDGYIEVVINGTTRRVMTTA